MRSQRQAEHVLVGQRLSCDRQVAVGDRVGDLRGRAQNSRSCAGPPSRARPCSDSGCVSVREVAGRDRVSDLGRAVQIGRHAVLARRPNPLSRRWSVPRPSGRDRRSRPRRRAGSPAPRPRLMLSDIQSAVPAAISSETSTMPTSIRRAPSYRLAASPEACFIWRRASSTSSTRWPCASAIPNRALKWSATLWPRRAHRAGWYP